MDATTATAFITANKGNDIAIVLNDGTEIYGAAISVNSKGVNIKDADTGKTRSVSLARIADLDTDNADDTYGADDTADDDAVDALDDDTYGSDDDADDLAAAELTDALNDVADSISDGATTAEVAAALSNVLDREITPKELRVHLRALGLGVGKGRKYALSAGELRAVHGVITAADADVAAAATN